MIEINNYLNNNCKLFPYGKWMKSLPSYIVCGKLQTLQNYYSIKAQNGQFDPSFMVYLTLLKQK